MPFFRMLELSEVATTARDLTPLLLAFRDFDPDAQRLVDQYWPLIAGDLDLYRDEDVVVVVREPDILCAVLPRAAAVAIALVKDVRLADAIAASKSERPLFDILVDTGARMTLLQVEHGVGCDGPR